MQSISSPNSKVISIGRSKELFSEAQQYIPGGVNSPVRAFKAVKGLPRFIGSAKGAMITDVDNNQYIDYVGSWGPMILGHSHPKVLQAVQKAAENGLSFGAPCELEVELAKEICMRMPHIEQVRMVNSGTEATMSAIRLARGVTGKDKIIKFEGCYHGHSDSLLVKAGSGALTFGSPSSPGVTMAVAQNTLCAQFNRLDSVSALFEQYPTDIAAVIIEPIAGNMNLILPLPGFLNGLRELCDHYGSLLIIDEVMTGFRVGPQGAQGLYQIKPDLTTLGKIIGGGLPVGAFGGSKELMSQLAPNGSIYQAGTLSGNPVAMAAGLATLKELTPDKYQQLGKITQQLCVGLQERALEYDIPFTIQFCTGMFGLFFTEQQHINHFQQVLDCDQNKFNEFFHIMLAAGVYLAPSAFEAGFTSLAHGDNEIHQTLAAAEQAFSVLQNST